VFLFLIKIDLYPPVIIRFRVHFLKMDSGQKETWKQAVNPIKPETGCFSCIHKPAWL